MVLFLDKKCQWFICYHYVELSYILEQNLSYCHCQRVLCNVSPTFFTPCLKVFHILYKTPFHFHIILCSTITIQRGKSTNSGTKWSRFSQALESIWLLRSQWSSSSTTNDLLFVNALLYLGQKEIYLS